MRNRLIDMLVQIVPVMIGVFLAFMVSDCAEESRTSEKADQMIEFLAAEIENNQQKIQQVAGYHQMLKDSTNYYVLNNSRMEEPPQFFKGVRNVSLSSGAYQSALQTGLISELSLEEIQLINELYEYQESYNQFNNLILESLIKFDFAETEEFQRFFRFLSVAMSDVVIKEGNLLEAYSRALDNLTKPD